MQYQQYTYQFKLKLTPIQEDRVDSWIGACRVVYNLALETRINAYRSYGKSINYYDLAGQLPELKKEADWIKDVPSQNMQDVLERQEKAYQVFFKGGGFPKWAKKGKYNSITLKSVKAHTHNRVKLPKLGSVKYFASQKMVGEMRRATIIKKIDGFYISILTRRETLSITNACENQAAIDLGVSHFLVTSDGQYIPNIRAFDQLRSSLRLEQRSLARKKRFSNNWYKQKRRVSLLQLKIGRIRNDYLNEISSQLANDYDRIFCEDLKIKNMSSSAKGTIENPGKNVTAKSGLNRSILDAGWGMFLTKMEYKLSWKGGELVRVNPAYTSQTCSNCGHKEKGNHKSQSVFKCKACDFEANADENASKNIMRLGKSHVRERKALA